MHVLHTCCCGLDVHKRFVVACLIRPNEDGKPHKVYWIQKFGSSPLFVLISKRSHAESRNRLRNSSKLPRPNIERFTNLRRLICPSTGPLLYGKIKEDLTAS